MGCIQILKFLCLVSTLECWVCFSSHLIPCVGFIEMPSIEVHFSSRDLALSVDKFVSTIAFCLCLL